MLVARIYKRDIPLFCKAGIIAHVLLRKEGVTAVVTGKRLARATVAWRPKEDELSRFLQP